MGKRMTKEEIDLESNYQCVLLDALIKQRTRLEEERDRLMFQHNANKAMLHDTKQQIRKAYYEMTKLEARKPVDDTQEDPHERITTF